MWDFSVVLSLVWVCLVRGRLFFRCCLSCLCCLLVWLVC